MTAGTDTQSSSEYIYIYVYEFYLEAIICRAFNPRPAFRDVCQRCGKSRRTSRGDVDSFLVEERESDSYLSLPISKLAQRERGPLCFMMAYCIPSFPTGIVAFIQSLGGALSLLCFFT